MNFLKSLTVNSFRKLEDGRLAFYPWGNFARGVIIQENSKKSFEIFLLSFYFLTFAGVLFVNYTFGVAYAAIFAFNMAILYGLCVYFAAKKLDSVSKSGSIIENAEFFARSINIYFIIFILIFSIVFFIVGIFMIFHEDVYWMGILNIGVWGVFGFSAAFLLFFRVRS